MPRAIRRTLSSAAVLALVAGSMIIAAPAQADEEGAQFTITSPSAGDNITGTFLLEGDVVDASGLKYWSVEVDRGESLFTLLEEGDRVETLPSPRHFSRVINICGFADGALPLLLYSFSGAEVQAIQYVTVNLVDTPECVQLDSPTPDITSTDGLVRISGSSYLGIGSYYWFDNQSSSPITFISGTNTFDFEAAVAGEGSHTLHIRTSNSHLQIPFRVDTSASVATPTPLAPSGFVKTATVLDWTDVGDPDRGSYEWELYDIHDVLIGSGHPSASEATLASALINGEYHFRVRAFDGAGDFSGWSEFLAFTVDSTNPVVGITTTMGTPISASTEVSGTYSDIGSGVVGVTLKFANCNLTNCFPKPGLSVAASLDGAGTWSARLPALDLERWGYQIIATATDAAGNTATTQQYYYVIDTAAPSVPVPLSPSGLVGPVSDFDWTDAADASNDVHYDWELLSPGGAASEACPAPPAPCPTAPPTTGTTSESHLTRTAPLTAEGVYKFRVRAVDALGNSSAWSAYLEFTIDSTTPDVSFDLEDDEADINSATPLVGGYYDGKGKTIAGVVLTLQDYVGGDDDPCTGTVGDPITAILAPGTWSADLVGIGYGHYCVTATATDGVGNTGTALGRFWIDTIAPDAPEPIAASGPVGPGSVLDWFDVDDDSELAVDYEYEVYDPSGLIGSGHTADSEVTADRLLANGGYHFRVRAIDTFGNVSGWSDGQAFVVDATVPTVSLAAPVAGASSSTGDVTFRWTSPDQDIELFVLEVSPTAEVDKWGQLTDRRTWVTSDSSQLVTGLANGRYYWHVIAYDHAWNESGWSELRILDVATPPAPPKSSGLGATGVIVDEPEPTEATEPMPEPSATEEPVEETDDEPAAETDDSSAGGSEVDAAGTGDAGFPAGWIIVGIVIVALGGGFFFIRFLVMRA